MMKFHLCWHSRRLKATIGNGAYRMLPTKRALACRNVGAKVCSGRDAQAVGHLSLSLAEGFLTLPYQTRTAYTAIGAGIAGYGS